VTFGTWHLIVSFWLLGALSPYAAVRAQIPPANSSASSLDLTLHVHPDSLTQPGISFGTYSSGEGADCDHRRESESTSKSDPGTTTPASQPTSDPLSPTPLQKPVRLLQLAERLNTLKALTKKFTGDRSLSSRWDFS
jgi:hypothetical protein